MQKQLIAVLLAGGLALAAQAADFPKEINITYVKAPFNLQNIVMKEQGLLEKAFEKDGVKVNWRVINSGADQSLAMASGALDFSAVMNTASLLLGAGAGNPIAIATGVAHPEKIFAMVGKPGSNLTVKDLKGKTVGVQIGTTAAAKAKEIEGAKVTTFNNASEAIMDLSTGNSVAVINDRPVTDYILVQQPALAEKTVHLTDQMLSADDFAMVVTKQNAKLQGELNAALKTLKENGEYDKIWKKWFGEAK